MTMSRTISLIGKYIILTFLSAAGIGANDCDEEVNSYFKPENSSGNWDKAWQTCNISNSTLPVIRSKEEQNTLLEYLRNHSMTFDVWTAGKKAAIANWNWTNGKPLRNKKVSIGPSHEYSVAVLNKEWEYIAQLPESTENFLCMYNYTSTWCNGEMDGFIKLTNGCLNRTINNASTWLEAQNYCQKSGGYLPVLYSEAGSSDPIRYVDWDQQVADAECISINHTNGRLIQTNCNNQHQFVCEKRVLSVSRTCDYDRPTTPSSMAAPTNNFRSLPTATSASSQMPSGSDHTSTNQPFAYALLLGIGIAVAIIFIIITIVVIKIFGNLSSKRTGHTESDTRLTQYRPKTTDQEVLPIKPPGTTNYGVYAEIPLATTSHSEDEGDTRPGIVYTSLDFGDATQNSKPPSTTGTVPPLGAEYAEVVAKSSNSEQGQPKVGPLGDIYAQVNKTTTTYANLPQNDQQQQPTGAIYNNL